jgi:phenylalanyl-tRNA synthetase beta chain
MRISLNWLRDLVPIDLSPQDLADRLTLAGFEVESIEERRTWAEGVVVGRVLERLPHPNADKLSICKVDIGGSVPSQIVCGASNVRAGIDVPVATLGTFLPQVGEAGLKIKPAKLRGEDSAGMICSLSELGLTAEADGIHIFDAAAHLAPGTDVRPLLGLDDTVLDLTSTANRADALSLVGIAREIAALTGATLKLPVHTADRRAVNPNLAVQITNTAACPTYIGTTITGITIAPSPPWLQQRLQASGVRPINNVVDVTNYIMLEWGQPLHAFDQQRLQTTAGGETLTLSVRFAEAGETLTTLDDADRQLQAAALVVTANDRPVALAGLMGGAATEIYSGTTDLMLEAAIFDSAVIRKSARSQGLRSEASARYERGVNLAELELAMNRAIALIVELAGGSVAAQAQADARPANLTRSVTLRLDRINQILGMVQVGDELADLTAADVEQTLTALNCQLTPIARRAPGPTGEFEGPSWTVTVPPYRYRDLEREIDLIEEVARLYGYDRFCDTLPEKTEPGYLSLEQMILRQLRSAFRGAGLTELVHYSLGKPDRPDQVVLSNPLLQEYSALRTDLLSGLIEACEFNLQQGNGVLNGFEIGHVFSRQEEGLLETEAVAGMIGGDRTQGKWSRSGRDQPLTWFEAKGILQSVFEGVGLPVEYQPDRRDDRLHPGRTASLWVQGDRLGSFGQLHPQLRQERDLPDEVYAFELDLDIVFKHLADPVVMMPTFAPYSTFPASDRDLAFFVPTDVAVADLSRTMTQAGGQLLQSVELFDEYRGERVPAGQRSLAFRLVYRTNDRTLTDADIDPVHQNVRETLVEKFRVDLRS